MRHPGRVRVENDQASGDLVSWGWVADAVQIAGTLGAAGIISTLISRKKIESESRELDANAFDKLTEAQIERQVNALQGAEEETRRAKEACNECRDELKGVNRRLAARDEATDALIDAVLEFLRLLPDASAEATLPVRNAITTARRARHNYKDE